MNSDRVADVPMRGHGKRRARREQIPSSGCDQSMRIDYELLGRPFIKVPVALGRLIQRDRLHVDGLGDLDLVMQDTLPELTIVSFHGALSGGEAVALGPAQTD